MRAEIGSQIIEDHKTGEQSHKNGVNDDLSTEIDTPYDEGQSQFSAFLGVALVRRRFEGIW